MIALLQRVSQASVRVDGEICGEIGPGLLVLLGVEAHDSEALAQKLCEKVVNYRIFSDPQGKMNLSLKQTGGQILVVSQFTLAADTQKGLRPSFSRGAPPDQARALYEYFLTCCKAQGLQTASGRFAADMQVSLINDGPVTFWLQM